MSVPAISTLRSEAEDLIQKASRGQNEAIITGGIAACVAAAPLSGTATALALIIECQPLIDQAGNDVLAIQTRQFLKLLEILANTIAGGGAPPGTLTDGNKTDITVSGGGVTWVINAGAVTYAKIQDVSAASRLLGRGASVAGDPQEISLGTGLSMAGTVLNAAAGGDALTTNPLSQFAATTSTQLRGVIFDETGTGLLVFNDGAVLITPHIGVAQATSVNKVAITPPATSATLTIADGATLTASASATVSGTNTGDNTNATTIVVADAGGDTTTFPMLAGAATGAQAPLTDAGLTYNSTTNALTVGSVVGALTGNADTATLASTVTTNANLTGPVTSVGNATTITDAAVTYAKIQDVSAASKLLGRGDSGAGDVQEITLGAGLTMTGSTLSAAGGGGSGDVVGPASATDGVPALFDGVTGKLLKDSTPTGTGNPVLDTSPTLVTPVLGVAVGTSLVNSQTALGAATADGLKVQNTTAAALGAQQWSPSIHWTGLGWGTTASTSQSVDFQAFVAPVQGTVPTGTWALQSSIAGGAYTTRFSVTSAGVVTATSSIFSSGDMQIGPGNSFQWFTSRSRMYSGSDGVITLTNSTNNGYVSLNIGPDVATPANVSLKAGSGVGADKTGGNLAIQAGLSTGAGVGGIIEFKTSPSTGSSSTANTPATALTIDQNGLSTFAFPLRLKGYTVATLPAAGTVGRMAYVTDSLTPTFLTAVVGGGAVISPVFDNGTAWVTA